MRTSRHNGLVAMVNGHAQKQRQYLVHEILASAGITINGTMPWDIRINDERFYERIALEGSLGLGESYMDGW
jgi:hypothetical protein